MTSNDRADLPKHLEFIQAVISRQASNSFVVKGWSVTLCSAIAAFGAQQGDWLYTFVLVIPSLAFWHLDAYYLRQERLFRYLYDDVRTAAVEPFAMAIQQYKGRCTHWEVLTAASVVGVHGVVIIVAELVILAGWLR